MSGLNVSATVKPGENLQWIAEVKDFDLEANGDTIEDAVASITPEIEQHLKKMFGTERRVSAELDGISAKASFSIKVFPDKTLEEFTDTDKKDGDE